MKKVTVKDIAGELGLSRNTVSKALRGSDIVARQTVQRVLQKALEMGYAKIPEETRAEIGRVMLKANRKIVIIARREVSEFWNRIIMGISDVIGKTDYSFMLYFISAEDEANLVLPRDISGRNVEGIIGLSVFCDAYMEKIFETKIPAVFYDAPPDMAANRFRADVVLVEGYYSTYELVSRLIAEGRKKFAFVGDIHYCRTVGDRWRGFFDALGDRGVPLDDRLCITEREPFRYFDLEELDRRLEPVLGRADAVVCANDDLALEAARLFRQKGLSVPEDVEVTGFDDKRNLTGRPTDFYTVHVDNEYVGRRMVELVLERIRNRARPYETVTVGTRVLCPHGEEDRLL